jgi:hypothetical protein
MASGKLYGFVIVSWHVSATGSLRRRLSSHSACEEIKTCFACSRLQDRERWVSTLWQLLASSEGGGGDGE